MKGGTDTISENMNNEAFTYAKFDDKLYKASHFEEQGRILDEVSWFADGDHLIQNEFNPTTMYRADRLFGGQQLLGRFMMLHLNMLLMEPWKSSYRLFGPTTTIKQIYDVAAQHAFNGAME